MSRYFNFHFNTFRASSLVSRSIFIIFVHTPTVMACNSIIDHPHYWSINNWSKDFTDTCQTHNPSTLYSKIPMTRRLNIISIFIVKLNTQELIHTIRLQNKRMQGLITIIIPQLNSGVIIPSIYLSLVYITAIQAVIFMAEYNNCVFTSV